MDKSVIGEGGGENEGAKDGRGKDPRITIDTL